jgi:hypothetical protein
MIPKKPASNLIRGGCRFSEKIMLDQKAKLGRETRLSGILTLFPSPGRLDKVWLSCPH